MLNCAIFVDQVSQSFHKNQVLESIHLRIEKGEKLVLIGPSGQGKSTLLKFMAGILIPEQGNVFIYGQNLNGLEEENRQNLINKMGMLFQKNALFDSLRVGENIAFPLRELSSLSEAEIQDKVDYFLEEVGLSHAKALFPDEISGGMQKRLGIARALALDPEIIFYDDPTAGLDPITSRKIVDLILSLQQKKGATMVAITNDMMRAYQMADRIAMVVDKKVIVTGSVSETKRYQDARVQQFIHGQTQGPLTQESSRD